MTWLPILAGYLWMAISIYLDEAHGHVFRPWERPHLCVYAALWPIVGLGLVVHTIWIGAVGLFGRTR